MKRILSLLLILAMSWTAGASDITLPGPLVSAKWLKENIDKVTVLDVRTDVQSFTARPIYSLDKKTGKKKLVRVAAHIPGAVLVDYKQVRSKRLVDGNQVDSLIPEADVFAQLIQKSGVNQDSVIIITSKGMNNLDMTMATRLYWQLKYYGHDKIAILNGGMAAWLDGEYEATTQVVEVKPGDWQASAERTELLASSDEVATAVKNGNVQLVDNRPLGQYLGLHKKSYVYAKGHIPGAINYPNELMTEAFAPSTFINKTTVELVMAKMGVNPDRPTITYCNSGHLASGGWFIMYEILGNKNVKLYDGSMHQWTLEKRETVGLGQ